MSFGIFILKGRFPMNTKTVDKSRLLTGCGMLAAVAIVLQYIEIAIPLMPSFIKLDLSDLPELIGAYAYGPAAGVTIAAVKNLIHMLASQSVGVGELSNFLLGIAFAFTAGFVYKRIRTKKGALLAGVLASFVMGLISYPVNLFVIYPLYYKVMNFPEPAILAMYQALLPSVGSISDALLIFNLPFTVVKGLLCVMLSMVIYKPLSGFLKNGGKRNHPSVRL